MMPKITRLPLLSPPPFEIYGLGEFQKVRDEVTYVVSVLEKLEQTCRGLADAIDNLGDVSD